MVKVVQDSTSNTDSLFSDTINQLIKYHPQINVSPNVYDNSSKKNELKTVDAYRLEKNTS